MDIETAVRMASTKAKKKLELGEAANIVQAFLDWVRKCPVCLDVGWVTFRQKTTLELPDRAEGGPVIVPADTRIPCPHCGGLLPSGAHRGDPDVLIWRCSVGEGEQICLDNKRRDDERRADCRALLRLPAIIAVGYEALHEDDES